MKNPAKIKAIIFDMDGTLVDNIPFHKEAWLLFLKKHNIPLESEQFNAQNHGNIEEMIKRFFGQDTPDTKVKELGQEKERIYRDLYKNQIKEIPGLTDCLKSMENQSIKAALATMGDTPNIDFILDTLKIRHFFHSITGGHEIIKGKPDAEIFELCLKKLDLRSKDCIVIEDSPDGVLSARQAGIKVVGITTSQTEEEMKKHGCFYTISNFDQLDLNLI